LIPSEEELLLFIKRKGIVNFSMIARQFEIQNATVSDLIASVKAKGRVNVKQLGGSKIVQLK
jgi:Mn-dependent DtxR family transcriptional regulator